MSMTNSERALRQAGEHIAVTDDLLREFTRQCDSALTAVANHRAFSMRTLVATVTSGDCYSASCLDALPKSRYEDFMCELTRAGWELGGDYVAGQAVLIVRAMPKVAR